MDNRFYLYRHSRNDKNEPFYIGVGRKCNSFATRETEYSRAYTKANRNIHWKRIINKTSYQIDILYECNDEQGILNKEIEFIKLYGRRDLNLGTLVNLTDGGEGISNPSKETRTKLRNSHLGVKLSEETKKRMSEAKKGKVPWWNIGRIRSEQENADHIKRITGNTYMLGKKHSEETLKKMSLSHSNQSEETRNKISKAGKGRKHTSEAKLKMSLAAKGRKFSEEHIKKLSEAKKGKTSNRIINK